MSLTKGWELLAAGALASAMVATLGCSSSSSSAPGGSADSGPDTGIIHHPGPGGGADAGDDGASSAGAPADGTTGKPCSTDANCKGMGPNAPGINVCSNKYAFKVTGVNVTFWPTPICILPLGMTSSVNCDPAPPTDPNGDALHFCDGPDDPSSPGFCLPLSTPTKTGQGICLPKCTFGPDGSTPAGCAGKDTCVPYTYTLDAMHNLQGYGFCQGSCQGDSDCSALGSAFKCQADIGFCTTQTVTRPVDGGGALGAACTDTPNQPAMCDCVTNSTTSSGFCSHACVIGGNACPMGWTCDNSMGGKIDFGDAGVFMQTKENTGTPGNCYPPCTMVDSGTGCPPSSTCSNATLNGPDCLP